MDQIVLIAAKQQILLITDKNTTEVQQKYNIRGKSN